MTNADQHIVVIGAGPGAADLITLRGLAAPKGTPQAIIDKMQAEVKKAFSAPELIKRFTDQGAEAGGHGATRGTLSFVPEVADHLQQHAPQTLLLAAGGIADGGGARAGHRGDQRVRIGFACPVTDAGGFTGQIDPGGFDPRLRIEHPFQSRRAGGAGHAGEFEIDVFERGHACTAVKGTVTTSPFSPNWRKSR